MKTCGRCCKEKPLKEFYNNSSRSDGLSSSCKECHKQYLKEHYRKNKAYYKAKSKNHLKRIQDYVRSLKEKTPCADCGTGYPYYVMDFDHVRGKKIMEISSLQAQAVAYEKIKNEIKKCEIVCSNCHRIRTHLRAASEKDDHATLRK